MPNIIIILADDLGFSDLGCYGGEIETPNLDGLAREGVRFTQFYNTARCWPTRAALMTGYYAQQVRRDAVEGVKSGAQGKRPEWARLLPEKLREAGYRNYHSGKWHIDGDPLKNGFDRSYIVSGAAESNYFSTRGNSEEGKPVPQTDGYYSTIAIADHAVKCLRDHAADYQDRPFFHYICFTAPHFPVQALPEDIEKYKNRYLAGWERIRQERYERLQAMKIVNCPLSAVEREVGPPYPNPEALLKLGPQEVNRPLPWDELTVAQQEFQAAKMAVHAAMVDRMDQEIGRVLAQLKAMHAWENTLLLFLSDNGASAEIMVRGEGHDPAAPPGSAKSFLCLGPGFSSVANTPFRRHKTWVHEGGIATPLVMHWPRGIKARGELRTTPGHVIDIVPTLLDLTGTPGPTEFNGTSVPAMPGKSLVPSLKEDVSVQREYLWWSHEGNRALRRGDWKVVKSGAQPWELYDLSRDRSETQNLAAERADLLDELVKLWETRRDEFRELALRDAPDEPTRKAGKAVK